MCTVSEASLILILSKLSSFQSNIYKSRLPLQYKISYLQLWPYSSKILTETMGLIKEACSLIRISATNQVMTGNSINLKWNWILQFKRCSLIPWEISIFPFAFLDLKNQHTWNLKRKMKQISIYLNKLNRKTTLITCLMKDRSLMDQNKIITLLALRINSDFYMRSSFYSNLRADIKTN